MGISDTLSGFNCFGGRLKIRWLLLLCVAATSTWFLVFSPLALMFSPLERVSTPDQQPQTPPPPQPTPGYNIPATPLDVVEPFTPAPLPENWEDAKRQVRDAFKFALDGYLMRAYPMDELRPSSGDGSNKFNGWGVTLYDSLDTMWIMDMKEEFNLALQLISKQNFSPSTSFYAPFFETVIRYLGGLLSAYALSKEPILLEQADTLALKLLPAFNGTASGLPSFSVNMMNGFPGFSRMGSTVIWAEATSCQLEFKYLAKLTGRKEYYERVEHVMELMYEAKPKDGLFTDRWTTDGKPFGAHHTVGASADSGYEYFLKQWLLMGDAKARDQYLTSIDGIINNLLHITPKRELLYVTSESLSHPTNSFEHLACFLPGLLALGAYTLPASYLPPEKAELHKWAAEGLAYTCYLTYADQGSGLGPDGMRMSDAGKWVDFLKDWEKSGRRGAIPPGLKEGGPVRKPGMSDRDYAILQPSYYLRPETVESFYILFKTTGNTKWRERGWEVFQAIQKFAKTRYGYGSVMKVDRPPYLPMNDMPSFFLAETLKYLYLLFDDTDILPIKEWVFNTEAHPLPVFKWTEEERESLGISLEGLV